MPIDLTLVDPNLLYVALLAGLWLGVTALYIPGTWLPETLSIILVLGSLWILASVATVWWAVGALVLGVSMFLVLPFFGEKYGRFAEVGLIGQIVGGLFLFQEQSVSPILIGVTVLLAFLYNRFILIPTIKSQRRRNEYDESNEVMGKRGRVHMDLDPVGTVYVNKELWRARSTTPISRDTPIRVIGQDGLELIVEKAKADDAPRYDEPENSQNQLEMKN